MDGDRLGIFPKEAAASALEELRQHKQEIVRLLSQRPQMPPGVRLVSWQPKSAPVQLSRCSTVTGVEKFIEVTLRQLAAHFSNKHWRAGNWGLAGLLNRLAACGCIVELRDPAFMAEENSPVLRLCIGAAHFAAVTRKT